jgi:preprotein translocase SecE subunit
MAAEVVRAPGKLDAFVAWIRSIGPFLTDVRAELLKVTWPDRKQLIALTRVIIIFVILISLLIWAMDGVLQLILVRGIPALFR